MSQSTSASSASASASGSGAPAPPPEHVAKGLCSFYLQQKRRFCKFECKKGNTMCPVHDGDKRIPCPLDPSHSIYEKDLEKHLKKEPNITKPAKSRKVWNMEVIRATMDRPPGAM